MARKRLVPWLAALVWWVAAAAPAGAHGIVLGAYATLTPGKPVPGQPAQIDLEIMDALNNPVAQLQVRVALVLAGQQPAEPGQPLNEVSPGRYRGTLTFPADGSYSIWIQALAPGAGYRGELPVTIGARGVPVAGAGVALAPTDEHPEQPQGPGFPWLWAGAGAAVLLFAVLLWLALRRGPGE